jgi:SAM-dependent methyltransferase
MAKKLYEKEWHGIKFKKIIKSKLTKEADVDFYNNFYREFFKKYESYENLSLSWRKSKNKIAEWLASRIKGKSRVLSVGCGIGYIENQLIGLSNNLDNLYIEEFSKNSLLWISKKINKEKIFLNLFDQVEYQKVKKFDLIYLSAVEYAFNDVDLCIFLKKLKELLVPGGILIVISVSEINATPLSLFKFEIKCLIKKIITLLRINEGEIFWGWLRTRDEIISIIRDANYKEVSYGYIDTSPKKSLWVSAVSS